MYHSFSNSLPLVLVELADYAYEKSLEVDIEPIDIINHIKERVEEKEGIPHVQQRFVFDSFNYLIYNNYIFYGLLYY